MNIRGRVWRFGDGITTDHIAPGHLYHLRSNLPELARHALAAVRPEFPAAVRPGDIVVGGSNFGLGSSREHAPAVLKIAGVGAVVASSFARIFFRNAINIGLPAVVCDTSRIADGQEIDIDLAAGRITNLTTGEVLAIAPLPPVMLTILADGGLMDHIRKHGGLRLGEGGPA